MSDLNGFNVIDAPRKGGKSSYAQMAEAIKSLPDGKAIQVELKNIANLHTTMGRLGIAIKTSKISAGVYAIWQKRPWPTAILRLEQGPHRKQVCRCLSRHLPGKPIPSIRMKQLNRSATWAAPGMRFCGFCA